VGWTALWVQASARGMVADAALKAVFGEDIAVGDDRSQLAFDSDPEEADYALT